MDVVSKSTGNSYTAAEFNQSNNELENALSSTGQTPASGDLFQIAKAMADYASHGDFYTDSGAADAYVLTATGSKQSPTAYTAGFRARFSVGNTNAGASTINVATLGVKSIKRSDGSALLAGDLTVGELVEIEYDGTDFILDKEVLTIEGIVKGWINFDGTGVIAISDSFNVSSIVDNGVGDYTINWNVDFASIDYVANGSVNNSNGQPHFINPAVGSIDPQLQSEVGVPFDASAVMITAIGDQ